MAHLAGAGDVPRRPGAQLRAAAHQRRRPTSATGSARCSPRWPRACRPARQPRLRGDRSSTLTQELPYNFGAVTQLLNETDTRFNTGSMRNIYSPDVRCANELVIDQLARAMRKDPLPVPARVPHGRARPRRARARSPRSAVGPLDARGHRAGHRDPQASTRAATAVLVEIDCRPETVNRKIRDGVTGPRSPRWSSPSTPAWWSTRWASRRR